MAFTNINNNNPIVMPSLHGGAWRRRRLLLLLWWLATMASAVTTTVFAAGHDDSAPVVWGDDGRRRRRRVSSRSGTKRRLQARIVGGKPVVAAAAVPSFAFPAGNKLCGATVIHPDVLLSAAHCAGAFVDDGVLIGGVDLSGMDATEFVGVVSELSHPLYQPGGSEQNDIMLVKLDRSIQNTAPLVQYNVNASVPNESDVLQIIGYGRTSTNGPNAATLQQVEVGLVANNECVAALRAQNLFVDPVTMLCTSTRSSGNATATVGSCDGDSGGPVFDIDSGVLVGIVSWGNGICGDPNSPDVNVRVSAYADWIFSSLCCLSDVPPADCRTDIDYCAVTTTIAPTTTIMPSRLPSLSPPTNISMTSPSSSPSSLKNDSDAILMPTARPGSNTTTVSQTTQTPTSFGPMNMPSSTHLSATLSSSTAVVVVAATGGSNFTIVIVGGNDNTAAPRQRPSDSPATAGSNSSTETAPSVSATVVGGGNATFTSTPSRQPSDTSPATGGSSGTTTTAPSVPSTTVDGGKTTFTSAAPGQRPSDRPATGGSNGTIASSPSVPSIAVGGNATLTLEPSQRPSDSPIHRSNNVPSPRPGSVPSLRTEMPSNPPTNITLPIAVSVGASSNTSSTTSFSPSSIPSTLPSESNGTVVSGNATTTIRPPSRSPSALPTFVPSKQQTGGRTNQTNPSMAPSDQKRGSLSGNTTTFVPSSSPTNLRGGSTNSSTVTAAPMADNTTSPITLPNPSPVSFPPSLAPSTAKSLGGTIVPTRGGSTIPSSMADSTTLVPSARSFTPGGSTVAPRAPSKAPFVKDTSKPTNSTPATDGGFQKTTGTNASSSGPPTKAPVDLPVAPLPTTRPVETPTLVEAPTLVPSMARSRDDTTAPTRGGQTVPSTMTDSTLAPGSRPSAASSTVVSSLAPTRTPFVSGGTAMLTSSTTAPDGRLQKPPSANVPSSGPTTKAPVDLPVSPSPTKRPVEASTLAPSSATSHNGTIGPTRGSQTVPSSKALSTLVPSSRSTTTKPDDTAATRPVSDGLFHKPSGTNVSSSVPTKAPAGFTAAPPRTKRPATLVPSIARNIVDTISPTRGDQTKPSSSSPMVNSTSLHHARPPATAGITVSSLTPNSSSSVVSGTFKPSLAPAIRPVIEGTVQKPGGSGAPVDSSVVPRPSKAPREASIAAKPALSDPIKDPAVAKSPSLTPSIVGKTTSSTMEPTRLPQPITKAPTKPFFEHLVQLASQLMSPVPPASKAPSGDIGTISPTQGDQTKPSSSSPMVNSTSLHHAQPPSTAGITVPSLTPNSSFSVVSGTSKPTLAPAIRPVIEGTVQKPGWSGAPVDTSVVPHPSKAHSVASIAAKPALSVPIKDPAVAKSPSLTPSIVGRITSPTMEPTRLPQPILKAPTRPFFEHLAQLASQLMSPVPPSSTAPSTDAAPPKPTPTILPVAPSRPFIDALLQIGKGSGPMVAPSSPSNSSEARPVLEKLAQKLQEKRPKLPKKTPKTSAPMAAPSAAISNAPAWAPNNGSVSRPLLEFLVQLLMNMNAKTSSSSAASITAPAVASKAPAMAPNSSNGRQPVLETLVQILPKRNTKGTVASTPMTVPSTVGQVPALTPGNSSNSGARPVLETLIMNVQQKNA